MIPDQSPYDWDHPDFACVSPAWPPIRFHLPARPYKIALVERGGCDFAHKIRAAQERGAAAVVVGDGAARIGETDAEGLKREGLITMFSPGECGAHRSRHCTSIVTVKQRKERFWLITKQTIPRRSTFQAYLSPARLSSF